MANRSNPKQDRATRTTITLYPKDWALARKVAHQSGSRSVSAGIRAMIAFYRLYHPAIEPQPIQHE